MNVEEKKKVNLESFQNDWFDPGAGYVKRALWYLMNVFFFKNSLIVSSRLKVFLLRLFGAKIGKSVVIKPSVNIKYPWHLQIGDHCWIGENVWIDNLTTITVGKNVTISQGAFLLTGNHNYKKPSFDLIVKPIVIEDGVWIGAMSTICPGITCGSHSVLSVGSIATGNLDPYWIYQGNPAEKLRERTIE